MTCNTSIKVNGFQPQVILPLLESKELFDDVNKLQPANEIQNNQLVQKKIENTPLNQNYGNYSRNSIFSRNLFTNV